jgi:hypothetical protein
LIAHLGTFDVANFGDLLFPRILERRLGGSGEEIVHISPVGGPAPLGGAVESVSVDRLSERPPTAVVIGGGHLIHASPSLVSSYRETKRRALDAYPSLWLGAAHAALRASVPLVWNAPGVPSAFGPDDGPVVAWAASFADYVSLRDARSLELLRGAGFEGEAEVVPDTGFDVGRLFAPNELDDAYRAVFRDRGRAPGAGTLAIHANSRYLGEEPGLVAARLDRLCASAGLEPILIGLGGCHGDGELARVLAHSMSKSAPIVVDEPRSLLEIVACISRSRAYLGSSLHGCITACAFGIPSLIVAREGSDGGKFSGLLGPLGLQAWLLPDWAEAEARAPEFLGIDPRPWRDVPKRVEPALDRHWMRVDSALQGPPRHPAIRAGALAGFEAMRRSAIDAFGIYAVLLPHQASQAVDQQASLARQRDHAAELKASYRAAARKLRRRIEELESQSD